MSAARPAVASAPDAAVAEKRPNESALAGRGPSAVFPLMILVLGLAVATMWFVALPALDKPATPKRSCEVIVLSSGATRCVKQPGARAAAKQTKPSRPKNS